VTRWNQMRSTVLLTLLLAISAAAMAQVTLRWVYPGWDSADQEAAVTRIVQEFEAANPDIRIDLQNIPWTVYHDRLIISLQGQGGPDGGYVITRWLPELHEMGHLADLTDRRSSLDLDDWFDSSWSDGTFDGRTFSIPDRREPYVFFYNTELFAEAGIDEFPSTMSGFLEAAQALTRDGRYGVALVGVQDATLPAFYLNFLYAFNGSVFDENGDIAIDNERGVEALQFYVDLFREHGVAQPSVLGDARDQARNLFMTGQVAMLLDGLYATGAFAQLAPDLEWGIGKVPQVEGRERKTLSTGWDNVIFTTSQHPEEAWRFIEFYTRAENMAASVMTLPVRQTAFESERFQTDFYDPWKDALQYGEPNPQTPHYERMMFVIGEAVQRALSGVATVEQALQDAATQIENLESGF
jgi:multiple sugar transport system substrate-binding protein